ncbi:MAG: glycosyltransferase family 4 protein [Thermoanaerobaculum sp.]
MRVLLVGPSWPLRGGIASTTTSLAAALAERGWLAGFCVPQRQYPRWLYPGSEDTDEAACPRLPQAKACFSLYNPFSWGALRREVITLAPEAVVVPHWTVAWVPLELFLTRLGLPVFGVVHNPFDHSGSPWSRWLSPAVLKRFRGFLVHARTVAWQLARWFPGKPLRLHPLPPPPVSPVARGQARAVLGIPGEAVVFLFFGLIRPYKGLDVLLEAVKLLPRGEPWMLAVAGEVWGDKRELVRRLEDLAIRGRVVLHDRWVPEEETRLWFSAADVVVLPYRRATGSAVAAQAFAYGLPVVASRTGGLLDVVEEGVNGLLVEPGDPVGLARALEATLDPEKRRLLRAGAWATGARWTWSSYASALGELIGEGLGSGS